uniref:RING-type domain-containing protein n=1 Tax=viral metagenome TaxID=1070528 RepID=A0A6C0F8E9_9ZZZZ
MNSYFLPIFFILGLNYSDMDDNSLEYKKISILRSKKIYELNKMIEVLRNHIEDLNEKLEKFISGEFSNNQTNLDECYRYQQIIQKLETKCKNLEIDFYCSEYKVKALEQVIEDPTTKVKSDLMCIICEENKRNILFSPCNHVVACEECYQKDTSGVCYVCREKVRKCEYAYLV